MATEMVALAEAAGDPVSRAPGPQLARGRPARARAGRRGCRGGRSLRRAGRRPRPAALRWFVPLWRGCLALLTGRWEEARAQGARARALGGRPTIRTPPSLCASRRSASARPAKDGRGADREWVVQMAGPPRPRRAPGRSGCPRSTWRGGAGTARAHGGGADPRRRPRLPGVDVNWHALCDLAEAIADLGERDAAHAVYERLAPLRAPVPGRGPRRGLLRLGRVLRGSPRGHARAVGGGGGTAEPSGRRGRARRRGTAGGAGHAATRRESERRGRGGGGPGTCSPRPSAARGRSTCRRSRPRPRPRSARSIRARRPRVRWRRRPRGPRSGRPRRRRARRRASPRRARGGGAEPSDQARPRPRAGSLTHDGGIHGTRAPSGRRSPGRGPPP